MDINLLVINVGNSRLALGAFIAGQLEFVKRVPNDDRAQWADGPDCRDFIFVTEDLIGRVRSIDVNEATDASDHQPISIELAD